MIQRRISATDVAQCLALEKCVQVSIDKSNEAIANAALRAVQRRGEKVKKNAYRGISPSGKHWMAQLYADGNRHHGGSHGHAIGAALAYDALLRIHMGSVKTAKLFNFATPEETKEAERELKQLQAAEVKGTVWAECELCSKWRLLPASITSWPGKFSCSMNPDTTRSSCDVEQEDVSQLW